MAALVLHQGTRLEPTDLEAFLAAQPDLSTKAWPRFVRVNDDLPSTATNKILKRELIAAGANAQGGVLFSRPPRGTTYTIEIGIPVGAQVVSTKQ
jgi:fatty-acyl-CoA synthase